MNLNYPTLDHLVSSTTPFIVKKNYSEGISDIRQLIQSSPTEAIYAYLPRKHLWLNLTKEHEESSVEIDMPTALMASLHHNARICHFHPKGFEKAASAMIEEVKKLCPRVNESFKRYIEAMIRAQEALPSGDDIGLMLTMSGILNKLAPKLKHQHVLFSEEGITSYRVKEAFIPSEAAESIRERISNIEMSGSKEIDMKEILKILKEYSIIRFRRV